MIVADFRLNKKQRDKIGSGFWLFDDPKYWDLTREALKPLLNFFDAHLK